MRGYSAPQSDAPSSTSLVCVRVRKIYVRKRKKTLLLKAHGRNLQKWNNQVGVVNQCDYVEGKIFDLLVLQFEVHSRAVMTFNICVWEYILLHYLSISLSVLTAVARITPTPLALTCIRVWVQWGPWPWWGREGSHCCAKPLAPCSLPTSSHHE